MKLQTGAGFALITLCAFLVPQTESYLIIELFKVAKLTFSSVYHTWDLFEGKLQPNEDSPYYQEKTVPEEFIMNDHPKFYVEKSEQTLLSRINEINRKIAGIEERMKAHEEVIITKLEQLPHAIMTEMKVNQVLDIVRDVESRHETFTKYMKTGVVESKEGKKGLDKVTVLNFAQFTTSHNQDSPLRFLDRLHSILVPHFDSDKLLGTRSFFYTFKDYLNQEEFTCDVEQSPQQMLFNMYTTLQLTQLKAYTMVHFSWMLLRLYDQGNFTVESELLKNSYLERMSQQAMVLKAVMKDCKNDMWACDPSKQVEGETFAKITKFLQGYIVNEVDLNGDGTCRENCAFYKYAKQQGCFKDQFCANQPTCRGNIVGCKFVDSDMWICQSPHFSERRYDWIEYENGRTLGQREQCSRAVRKVDSWWRYLFWHCSYCFCYCDDPQDSQSDRFFSLRPVTVDTNKNKVMTGMRFVKLNRIIHLQVQQGELLPHGEINETTVAWVPVEEFGIKDEGVEVGKDYHMLTWEHRALDLDDIQLPEGHLLTGIRIRRLGGHMNLEIQGTEFNYTTGTLTHNGSKSQWFGNDNTDGAFHQPRTAHVLKNPDVPNRSSGLNKIDSRPDTFVEFTASDSDLDVAQTAVPFIDLQPVAPRPACPLVGAGVFHKGRRYSGGFVGLKAFTYNQGNNVQDVFPEVNEAEF